MDYCEPGRDYTANIKRNNALISSAGIIHAGIKRELKGNTRLNKKITGSLLDLLEHLIPNAVDAVFERIDRGDLVLIGSGDLVRFKVFVFPDGSHRFILSDSGIGMDKKQLADVANCRYQSYKSSSYFPAYMGGHCQGVKKVLDSAWRNSFSICFLSKKAGENPCAFLQDAGKRLSFFSGAKVGRGTDIVICPRSDESG